jgi:hypothetical protein
MDTFIALTLQTENPSGIIPLLAEQIFHLLQFGMVAYTLVQAMVTLLALIFMTGHVFG